MKRNDLFESSNLGVSWKELDSDKLPACASERGAFMAPFRYTRLVNHPYVNSSEYHKHFVSTPFEHPEYSAACIPFNWMLTEAVEGTDGVEGLAEKYSLGYMKDREPDLDFKTGWVQERENQLALLDTFFSAVEPEESLCFFYAKHTPFAEDTRRIIIGVGRVTSLGAFVEYKSSVANPPLRCVLWERSVGHSIRPGFRDGFLFPYQTLLERCAQDSSLNPTDFGAFTAAEAFDEFSFGSAHVGRDAAIQGLLACVKAIDTMQKVVEAPWSSILKWIDEQMNRLWKLRGPFPGFGSALTAFGIPHGNLLAYAIEALCREGGQFVQNPWNLWDKFIDDPSVVKSVGAESVGASFRSQWKRLGSERKALLQLLSRFEISGGQATRYYQPTERQKAGIELKDADILRNPYLLFETDRIQLDAVDLAPIDRGIYPDATIRDGFPIPQPSTPDDVVDARRVRAFMVQALEDAATSGSTLQPQDWIIQTVRHRPAATKCPLSIDALNVIDETLSPVIQKVEIADGTRGYQLDRYSGAGKIINQAVERRMKGSRHEGNYDWRSMLDAALPGIESGEDQINEERARQEKAAALSELFASRITVLVGSAGTGKTTLLRLLCQVPDVYRGGILPLAPTGKARVRLESQAQQTGGKTIAQCSDINGLRFNTKRTSSDLYKKINSTRTSPTVALPSRELLNCDLIAPPCCRGE